VVTAVALAAFGLATASSPAAVTAASHTVVRSAAEKTTAGDGVRAAAVPGASAAAVAVAQRDARASGRAAVVAGATTATDQTLANPNGSFTLVRHVLPVRARNNGAWVAVNATLVRGPGGTVSPVAVNEHLSFSGGGRGPLVSMADAAGHALSLWWPTALPAPALSGATVTYRGVLPGVDLRMTASAEGGFSDVLIVKSANAARSPALRVLRLRMRTTKLRVVTGRAGNLIATDSMTGAPVFSAPPSALWDSAAARTPISAAALAGAPAASSSAGPGRGAHRAVLQVSVRHGTLVLAPPASLISGPGTVYPLYVDPSITTTRSVWTYVAQRYPDQPYMNNSHNDGHARVGYDNWLPNSNGQTYSYFMLGSFSGMANDDIVSASLALTQTSASCPNCTFTVNTQLSGVIGNTTTWNNQPGWYGYNASVPVSGNAIYEIDETPVVQWFADQIHGDQLTLVVYENGTDQNDYRYFANNPTIAVTYWSYPAVPSALSTTPMLNEGLGKPLSGCDTTAPGGWVNKTAGANIQLSATTSTPDVGYPLWEQFMVGQNGAAPGPGPATTSSYNAVPGSNRLTAPLTVTDGASYEYHAYATNGHASSAGSAPCYFRVDETPPSGPSVSWPRPAIGVLPHGEMDFTATDPGPAPSGIAGFNYNLDGASLSSPGEQTVAASNGRASINLPGSLRWGTHSMWVQAIDNAGNVSTAVRFTWYVAASSGSGMVGDINGDGQPDLVAVDAAGAIRLYSNPLTTAPQSTTGSAALDQKYGGVTLVGPHSPNWPFASFAGAIVTHAGTFTSNQLVDDLIIWQNGNLYLGQNTDNGLPAGWTFTSALPKPACAACGANYNSQDWSSVTAMVALSPAAAGRRPSLLTLENFNGVYGLWLYPPLPASLGFGPPALISTNTTGWDWSAMTLISPNQITGGGHTLWARDTGSGNLYQFTDIEAGIPNPATSAVQIGSGFTADRYPILASEGDIENTGHPDLWALTSATGTPAQALEVFPGTALAGNQAFGPPEQLSTAGWGANIVSLDNNSTAYNSPGLISDGAAAPTSFDGDGTDYSAQSLAASPLAAGYCSQQPADWSSAQPCSATSGIAPARLIETPAAGSFRFPPADPGVLDNYAADGQVVPAPTAVNYPAQTISFLGAATNVPAAETTGAVTITYTDGSTQKITIGVGEWLPKPGIDDNTVVAACPYRDVVTGGAHAENLTANLYATPAYPLAVPAGQQIASITLGQTAASGTIHIFSIAVS
jgi:hypothetical protein